MVKKRVILTTHASDRMKQRGVSLEDVRKTIDSPTEKKTISKDGTQELRREEEGKTNVVIVQHKLNRDIIIVTTWWES